MPLHHFAGSHFASGHLSSLSGSEAASSSVSATTEGGYVGTSPGEGKGARRRYRRRTRYGVTLSPRDTSGFSVAILHTPPSRSVHVTTNPARGLVVAGLPSLPRIEAWHLLVGAALVGGVAFAFGRRTSPLEEKGKGKRKGKANARHVVD